MKAAVFISPFDMTIKEILTPSPAPAEALVRIKAAGICSGDLLFWNGKHPYGKYPAIGGHELVGIIESINGNSNSLSTGDMVVVEPLLACGKCWPCRHGKYNCCTDLKVIGAHTAGGFAEYICMPLEKLHRVPKGVTIEQAVLAEPFTIGAHGINRAGNVSGETILVIGAGTIGLTAIDLAKAKGARVIACDIHPFRLQKAAAIGADDVIDAKQENLLDRVLELTDGEGAGIVIEATGVSAVMAQTEDLVAAGGTIVIIGLTQDKVTFTGLNFTRKEMNVLGSRNSAGEFPEVLDMMERGNLHPSTVLTHRYHFAQFAKAVAYSYENKDKIIKSVVFFD